MEKSVFRVTSLTALGSIVFLVLGLMAKPIFALDPPTGMPQDPTALLKLAADSNGLEQEGIKPWHMVISFQVMDDQGNVKNEGTIEESWVERNQYKLLYKSGASSWQDFGTEKGIMRTGSSDAPFSPAESILRGFTQPIPDEKTRAPWILDVTEHNVNGASLRCLTMKGLSLPAGNRTVNGPAYCLDADRPVLRVSSNPNDGTHLLHNNIHIFQGRYLPSDLQAVREGKITFKAHLERIELVDPVDVAEFVPPPDAKPVEIRIVISKKRIAISSGVATAHLIRQVKPDYPLYAMNLHIQGTVVLQAVIQKDGRIGDLRVVAGPSELQYSAMEAVRQWVYKPYLLNGEPVVVDTTINVVFNLGR